MLTQNYVVYDDENNILYDHSINITDDIKDLIMHLDTSDLNGDDLVSYMDHKLHQRLEIEDLPQKHREAFIKIKKLPYNEVLYIIEMVCNTH